MRAKKYGLTIVMIFLISFFLSGCSRANLLDYITSRDDKDFQEILDQVFVELDSGDAEGLKNLFAKTVIEENPDLESEIEAFFQVYKGPMEIEEIDYSTGGTEKVSDGKRRTILQVL